MFGGFRFFGFESLMPKYDASNAATQTNQPTVSQTPEIQLMPNPRFQSVESTFQQTTISRLICLVAIMQALTGGQQINAQDYRLDAPAAWGGETIQLPPGFAKDMLLQGVEHIRFAPGMMDPQSETFFCYAFAFELESKPKLTKQTIKSEFLKYYRGLSKAVLNGKRPELPFENFEFEFELAFAEPNATTAKEAENDVMDYAGKLKWVEPFATKKTQQLNVEIRQWATGDRNYLFASVSPKKRNGGIWKQLHKIRDDYVKSLTAASVDQKPAKFR